MGTHFIYDYIGKIFVLKNNTPENFEIYMETFSQSPELSLLKAWAPEIG
jgi:hypothetical protein